MFSSICSSDKSFFNQSRFILTHFVQIILFQIPQYSLFTAANIDLDTQDNEPRSHCVIPILAKIH